LLFRVPRYIDVSLYCFSRNNEPSCTTTLCLKYLVVNHLHLYVYNCLLILLYLDVTFIYIYIFGYDYTRMDDDDAKGPTILQD
jgi:Ca2+/Na+ antiporter